MNYYVNLMNIYSNGFTSEKVKIYNIKRYQKHPEINLFINNDVIDELVRDYGIYINDLEKNINTSDFYDFFPKIKEFQNENHIEINQEIKKYLKVNLLEFGEFYQNKVFINPKNKNIIILMGNTLYKIKNFQIYFENLHKPKFFLSYPWIDLEVDPYYLFNYNFISFNKI